MPDNAPAYNVSTVHKLLVATFTAEELRRFCRDRPAFSAVLSRFSAQHGLEDMVDEVIDYCQTRDLFDRLMAEIEQENPAQYARFEPALRSDVEALAVKILKPGNTLLKGKYRIERHVAAGGFGSVYLAEETLLSEAVAIKELIPALVGDEQALRRFLIEAKTTMKLAHPHVAHTRDVFAEAGNYYMVMEWAPGGSLEDALRDKRALPADEAVRIAAEVAAGLAYAHAQGVVHCDLKPGNILFGAAPATGTRGPAKVADFGVAHVSETTLTRSWTTGGAFVAGTLPYMSPEQTDGVRDDPRVDVYALGAVLYRMLTGSTYIEFDQRDTPRAQSENVQRICAERPAAPSSRDERIPPWLDRVVLKALAKRPEARFATMDEMRAALLRPPRPRPRPQPGTQPSRPPSVPPPSEAPAAGPQPGALPAAPVHGRGEPAIKAAEQPAPLDAGPAAAPPAFEAAPEPAAASEQPDEGRPAVEAGPAPLHAGPAAAPPAFEAAPEPAAASEQPDEGRPAVEAGPAPAAETPVEPQPVEPRAAPEARPRPAPSAASPGVFPAAPRTQAPARAASAASAGPARRRLPTWLWAAAGGVLLVAVVVVVLALLPGGGHPGLVVPEATQPAAIPVSASGPGRIAFSAGRDGSADIYVMSHDGSGQTSLTDHLADDTQPAWSFDGSRIAFVSDRDGNLEIYVMNADGTGVTRLTDNPADDSRPAWSPDGGRIAFESWRDGPANVYVMNADGTDQRCLTCDSGGGWRPAWSITGYIAFSSDRGDNMDIYIMSADGSGQTRLTDSPGSDYDPAWSPDGSRIAFISDLDGLEIYVMNADGSNPTRLTRNTDDDAMPTWSPDGKRIAFDSWHDGNGNIYVVNADGSGLTRLTDDPANDQEPAWSR